MIPGDAILPLIWLLAMAVQCRLEVRSEAHNCVCTRADGHSHPAPAS